MAGKLTVAERLRVVRAAMPWLAERPAHQLLTEQLDVEICLAGGSPPNMTIETRLRVLDEARRVQEAGK